MILRSVLAAGRSWFWHRRAGLGEAARILVVARPHRILVDDGPEQSRRGNQMGHVVRRRKILRGECLRPPFILLSGDFFLLFFLIAGIELKGPLVYHSLGVYLLLFAQLIPVSIVFKLVK